MSGTILQIKRRLCPQGMTTYTDPIVLVCGLAEIGVQAVLADGERAVVGAALLVLLLPDSAALYQLAAGGGEGAVRGSQGEPVAAEKWSTARSCI